MTSLRKSIDVPGLGHPGLPIPVASRVGPIIASGGIRGVNAASGDLPKDLAEQTRFLFANIRAIVEAGGGSVETIVKISVWIAVPEAREAVNAEWIKMFPDKKSRPARHTMPASLPGGMLVQCDFLAVALDTAST